MWAGTLADLLSPARLVIFGTLLTTLNKPMFAGSGYIYATYGTVATLYWVTAAKVRPPSAKLGEQSPSDGGDRRHNSGAARAAAGRRPRAASAISGAQAHDLDLRLELPSQVCARERALACVWVCAPKAA